MQETQTHLALSIEKSDKQAKYDNNIKDILSDKQVLARIMKYSVKEYEHSNIYEIMECIEGSPQVGIKSIYPGKSEKIVGLNTESKIKSEGEVTYDIYFYAVTPEKERVKMVLNVEAQKNYYPGYHFVPRGIFYCSRMISEQLDTEFTVDNYDDIKKVYSIWICTEAPEKYANTISAYSIKSQEIYGDFTGEEIYDLLTVIIIRLSKKENVENGNKLHQMLNILLSHKLDVDVKKKMLEQEHKMVMNKKLERGLNIMCNLSYSLLDDALKSFIIKTLKKGRTAQEISEFNDIELDIVQAVEKEYKESCDKLVKV